MIRLAWRSTLKGVLTMTLTAEYFILGGAADQVKIAASTLKFLKDILPPEKAALLAENLDEEIAKGFELAEQARKMAEELKE
jgi:uncharacterized protein (DUF2267 family)